MDATSTITLTKCVVNAVGYGNDCQFWIRHGDARIAYRKARAAARWGFKALDINSKQALKMSQA